ncbi:MAG TPA: alpha/beta fold hydrolase [Rhizomicrobium sp.]|jgi:thioesterase domain-containing protein/acyl carrier protein|nr:alpha/beta fold hydrolase [Rhizomicrobium sp.]
MNPATRTKEILHPDIAARLGEIWSRTLNISPIGPEDDFFDLGGDSLLAVGLFLEIERETGISLPITTIYDAPTINALADIITGEAAAPKFSPLVLLKPGDDGAPLFIVHGIGGTVMELAAVGRAIRIPAPVYALQAQGLDGSKPPLESLDDMVALYLDHVRALQPEGPYRLSGYSFGGLVALEMARRLIHEYQETAEPILIDTYAHPDTWPRVSRLKMQARRTVHLAGQFGRAPIRKSLPALLARLHGGPPKDARARLRDWLLDRNPDLPAPLLRVREAGSVALARYTPRFYPGKIAFLKASHPDPEFPDDPERIWKPLVQDMDIRIVPGRHRTMISDHAAALADHLTACVLASSSAPEAVSSRRTSPTNKPRLRPQTV